MEISAETCSQPLLSHRQQTILYSLLSTVNFEAALLQQLFIFKGKLLPGKSFLLHTRAEVLTPAPGQGAPRYFLRAMLQLSKALGNSQRKGFVSALGWFFNMCIWGFPTRGEDCSEGGIQMIQEVSVMTALLGHSARQLHRGPSRAKTTVFNLLCLGDLKRSKMITSGIKLMMMIWFHPRARPNVQFSIPAPPPPPALWIAQRWGSRTAGENAMDHPQASREKGVLYWKEWFLEESSHLYNIKG